MKLKKVVGLTITLMIFSGFVFADLDNSGSLAPEFTDPSGATMSFNYEETGTDQASLGSCAMNPTAGNNVSGVMLEEPPVELEPEQASFVDDAQPLLSEMDSRPPYRAIGTNDGPRLLSDPPEGSDSNPLNPTTPEPATLLIIGMSAVGFVPLIKRYRRKQTTH
jgi:hypothetical protein